MSLDARTIRDRLAFDVARLAEAARRLQGVDDDLYELKTRLEARATSLAEAATEESRPENDDEARIMVRYAQAQRVAELARRSALKEVLRSPTAVPMIAAMAVSRWLHALRGIRHGPGGERAVKLHVEAGRIACRVLRTLRRRRGLRSGVGRLTSAVVVAEFAHPDDMCWVDVEIEHGLYTSRFARSISSAEEAFSASSLLLREAAYLLERVASVAEPSVDELLEEAASVEQDVEAALSS